MGLFSLSKKVFLVKKFIFKLRLQISSRNQNLLNSKILNAINDLSYFEKKRSIKIKNEKFLSLEKIDTFFQDFLFKLKEKVPKIHPINPSGKFKIFWDLITIIFNILMFFIIPFDISFKKNIITEYIFHTRYLVPIFYTITILINLNTANFEKGSLISSRRKMIFYYLKTHFIIDFFTLYPAANFNHRTYVDLTIFLNMLKFNALIRKMEQFLFADEKFLNYIKLIKLIFNICLLSHTCACLWYYIGVSNKNQENWLEKKKLLEKCAFDQYIYSIYFIVISMLTVGYGLFYLIRYFLINIKNFKVM